MNELAEVMKALEGKKKQLEDYVATKNRVAHASVRTPAETLAIRKELKSSNFVTPDDSARNRKMHKMIWKFDTLWEHPLGKGQATCHLLSLYRSPRLSWCW